MEVLISLAEFNEEIEDFLELAFDETKTSDFFNVEDLLVEFVLFALVLHALLSTEDFFTRVTPD